MIFLPPTLSEINEAIGTGTLQAGTLEADTTKTASLDMRSSSGVQFGIINASGASLKLATSSSGWPLVLSGDGVRIDAGAAGTQNLQIGGLTINPGNGAHTLDQTFALQLRTSNALNLIHGTGDPCYVKPRSGAGIGKIGFQNGTNSYQSHISGGSGEVSFFSALDESALASIQASGLRNSLGPVSLQAYESSTPVWQTGVEVQANSGGVKLGFFGETPTSKPDLDFTTATLADLLSELETLGLINDSS